MHTITKVDLMDKMHLATPEKLSAHCLLPPALKLPFFCQGMGELSYKPSCSFGRYG